ncbi:MAG: hypothetical protein ACSHX9_00290 [Luteolibacter sp.]
MKYIRFKYGKFILFSGDFIHANVARSAESISGPPVSAGFVVRAADGELACRGQSDSLDLVADPEDTELLAKFLCSAPKVNTL